MRGTLKALTNSKTPHLIGKKVKNVVDFKIQHNQTERVPPTGVRNTMTSCLSCPLALFSNSPAMGLISQLDPQARVACLSLLPHLSLWFSSLQSWNNLLRSLVASCWPHPYFSPYLTWHFCSLEIISCSFLETEISLKWFIFPWPPPQLHVHSSEK